MIKPKIRRCIDCGKDISNRFILAKRCLECSIARDHRLSARRNRARRRAEREAQS